MSNRSQLAVILAFAAGAMAGHSFENVVDSYNNDNQQALETEVTEPV